MTALGAVVGWTVVMGLLWIAGACLLTAITRANPTYAVFAVVFGLCSLLLSISVVREGRR